MLGERETGTGMKLLPVFVLLTSGSLAWSRLVATSWTSPLYRLSENYRNQHSSTLLPLLTVTQVSHSGTMLTFVASSARLMCIKPCCFDCCCGLMW